MVEKLIKIYKNKIIQNIKEFDYDNYYYFYSNNYNDDIFGIEKTISENEYHLITQRRRGIFCRQVDDY